MTNYRVLEEKEDPQSDAPTVTTPSAVENSHERLHDAASSSKDASPASHPEVAVPPELPSSNPSIRTSSFPYSPSSVLGSPRGLQEPNLFTFPQRPLPNPEEHCNPLSYITYSWLSPLIAVGATRPLSDNDLFEVRTDYAAKVAAKRFEEEWAKEVRRAEAAGDRSSASLYAPFKAIYGRNYALAFLSKAVGDLLSFAQPMLLQLLLSSLGSQSLLYCMVVAFSLFVSGTLSTVTCNLYWRVTMVIGVQARNCLITAVYAKSLRLSPKARSERSTGQIVNLMSTDASKIDSALGWALTLVACLLQVVVAVALLVNTLGASSLAGVAVIVVLIPVQGKVVGVLQAIRKKAVLWTDRRVKLSNEILQGIKVIKVQAWEPAFLKRLTSIRLDEMALIRRGQYVRAGAVTIAQFGPILMSLVAFIVLASTGGDLTPENVFAALVLFNLLRFPLMQVPFVGGMIADALVSKGRIEGFLLSEEIVDQAERVDDKDIAVRIEGGDFSWEAVIQDLNDGDDSRKGLASPKADKDKDKAKPGLLSTVLSRLRAKPTPKPKAKAGYKGRVSGQQGGADSLLGDYDGSEEEKAAPDSPSSPVIPSHLRDVNIRIPHGSLTVVVGNVGSGKSSLLSGILGEMKRRAGRVALSGSVGYCAQTAWIQNASLRDNVLFGLPYDERRYREVLKVCELERDLDILPAGDATEIGEKGITLSGGQKQRVNLARGVYFDADVLLLDDIFSALDMHVGASIFHKCILGTLRHKTRLLVTHQLQYCQFATHILFLQDGRIAEQGTFDELIKANSGFAALIASYGGGANDEEEQEEVAERQRAQDEVDEEKSLTPVKRRLSRQQSGGGGTPNKALSRRGSLKEGDEVERLKKANQAKLGELMTVEERSTGGIPLSVYKYYLSSLGGPLALFFLVFLIVMGTVTKMATDLWLAYWSEQRWDIGVHWYMIVYAGLGLSQCLFVFLLAFFVARLSTIGAVRLHDRSFASVTRAPLTFFDTTPLGRILHRFSKDQDTIDTTLSESIRSVILLGAQIVGSLILMCIATPFFIIPLLPCMYGYWWIQKNFRQSSREVKRMDSTTRSPLFAHFSETLTGLSTIRAYHRESVFIDGNHTRLDGNVRAYYLVILMQRWIGLRLETLASAIVFFSAAVIVLTSFYGSIGVGLAGLSLSYAISMTTSLVFMIRQSIEAEMAMNSVERSQYYAEEIAQEKPGIMEADRRLIGADPARPQAHPHWPPQGRVSFVHLSMRYRPNLPLILSDISIDIRAGERVGIVGRTGAGKSSLMTALFRLVEPEKGHIEIDGVDINDVGLRTLRQSLSIIPQDAMLFTGTIRSNLDPLKAYSDDELWSVLEKSHLKATISRLEMKLEAPVNEGGENFSVGEKCQLCLARAMLKDTRILVMDEATASIDLETDSVIQQSIREAFPNVTIITIAHRLITVVDYDRILVLSEGKVVEFDTPAALLKKEDGAFKALVAETGETNATLLLQLATQAASNGGRLQFTKEVLEQAH